ncbi:hypothetical protein EV182_005190, partial [Spiromyces aspiralis]
MPICTRFGCGKQYDEASNSASACQYHEEAPIFHEGLKKWPCCNKTFTHFDDFEKCPGCKLGAHVTEKKPPKEQQPADAGEDIPKPTSICGNTETFVTSGDASLFAPKQPSNSTLAVAPSPARLQPQEIVIDEDPEGVAVRPGTPCKRHGCSYKFVSDSESRGEGAKCVFHPGAPIFHEATRGWSCCKRRVADFDEFLAIKGCREGRHLFVGSKSAREQRERESTRIDFYQNSQNVIVSVYFKRADGAQSSIEFVDPYTIKLDLVSKD